MGGRFVDQDSTGIAFRTSSGTLVGAAVVVSWLGLFHPKRTNVVKFALLRRAYSFEWEKLIRMPDINDGGGGRGQPGGIDVSYGGKSVE